MANAENIRDVFSVLHDGTIIEWAGDKNLLTLKIGCQYLAERIDSTFENFFVELFNINRLALVPWMNPIELEQEYFVELKDIFQAELDILSADIENDLVKVICNQRNVDFDYCGGTLYINCNEIRIYDQERNELTMERLDQIGREYWDEFARQ